MILPSEDDDIIGLGYNPRPKTYTEEQVKEMILAYAKWLTGRPPREGEPRNFEEWWKKNK